MDAQQGIRLCIVEAASVRPHEIADPAREQRIEQRLREDGMLRDPLIVGAVPDFDGYVLLDGTNRKRALAALGVPWLMVQVLDYANPSVVQLRTWCHAAHVPLAHILDVARGIPGVEVSSLSPLAAPETLEAPATLAVLLDRGERYALSRVTGADTPRAVQLRKLVDCYEEQMVRIDCDPQEIEERAHTLGGEEGGATLIAFPRFTRSAVVAMAIDGTLIPAGITRHVLLGGRALRVNLPLDMLRGDDLEAANRALDAHVRTLHPRTYREPTVLYDS